MRGVILKVEPRGFEPLTSAVQMRCDSLLDLSGACKIAAKSAVSMIVHFLTFQAIYPRCCTVAAQMHCSQHLGYTTQLPYDSSLPSRLVQPMSVSAPPQRSGETAIINSLTREALSYAVEVGARGRAGFSKLPTEALQFRAVSYLQRRPLPPSARLSIKPPTPSMTKPQKTFDTMSSPRASRTNTAPAMNKSVPHTSPDWRYSIRAATSPPPRLLFRVASSSLSTRKSTKAPATSRSMPKKGLNPISSPRALRTTSTPATSKTVPHTTPDSRCCIAATPLSRFPERLTVSGANMMPAAPTLCQLPRTPYFYAVG